MRILNKEKLKTYFFYFTVFITGGVVLVIEILGARMLAPFYGSTIFVWSSLITITMGALALGYFFGGFLADKNPEFRIFYGIIFIAGFFTAFATKAQQPLLVFSDRFGLRFGPLFASFVLFSAPLFLLGMVSPFAIRLCSGVVEKVGRASGRVFAFATLGSLAGALLSGFFLVPAFSLSSVLAACGGLLTGLALFGVFLFAQEKKRKREFFLTLLIAVCFNVALFYFPKLLYRKDDFGFKVVHQEQSFYADLKIIQGRGVRCLFMDGAPQTCIALEGDDVSPSGYILELKRLSQTWPKESRILLLGFGAGAVVKALDKEFALDIVELDPQIVKLAEKYFDFRLAQNARLFIDDARSFLRKTNGIYDIIISDLYFGNTIPVYLYTKEFSGLLKEHLAQKGVVVTNLLGRLAGQDRLIVSLARTQAEVFPNLIITANNPQEVFGNILMHASLSQDYSPSLAAYQKQAVDLGKGLVITDDKNPLDILIVQSAKDFLANIKKTLGYLPLFSL